MRGCFSFFYITTPMFILCSFFFCVCLLCCDQTRRRICHWIFWHFAGIARSSRAVEETFEQQSIFVVSFLMARVPSERTPSIGPPDILHPTTSRVDGGYTVPIFDFINDYHRETFSPHNLNIPDLRTQYQQTRGQIFQLSTKRQMSGVKTSVDELECLIFLKLICPQGVIH